MAEIAVKTLFYKEVDILLNRIRSTKAFKDRAKNNLVDLILALFLYDAIIKKFKLVLK